MTGVFLLFIAFAWLIAAMWISRLLSLKVKTRGARSIAALIAFSLLLPLPLADEIVGMTQFASLCKQGAQLKIDAQQIKGKAIRVVVSPSWVRVANTAIPITYSRYSYRDVSTGEELASYMSYRAKGGILVRALGIFDGNVPLLIGTPWCGPSELGSIPAKHGFTLTN